jgi:hypothetical protein
MQNTKRSDYWLHHVHSSSHSSISPHGTPRFPLDGFYIGNLHKYLVTKQGPGIAYWLRRCAASRTVPGSISGGVTGFFSDIFPSDRTMALGSTQPLGPGTFLGVKAGSARGWPHHLHVPNVTKSGSLNLLEPSGPHRACYGTPLPFIFYMNTKLKFG